MATDRLERFEKELQSRRSFFQNFFAKLTGASLLGTFLSSLAYLYPASKSTRDDGVFRDADGKPVSAGDIPPGGAIVGRLGRRPALVLNRAGELVALSAVCTHLGCIVAWDAEKHLILCPCHGGVFAPDGRNIAGPPPRPLPHIAIVVENGNIITSATTSTG
jgi:cytochrome b6-f complex iron-sulfur subunit